MLANAVQFMGYSLLCALWQHLALGHTPRLLNLYTTYNANKPKRQLPPTYHKS